MGLLGLEGCQVLGLRYDLLGAKLNSFINALRIGRSYDLNVKAFWPVTGPSSKSRWARQLSRPDEIFSDEFIANYLWTDPPFITDTSENFVYAASYGAFKSVDDLYDAFKGNRIIAIKERLRVISFTWENIHETEAQFAEAFREVFEFSAKARAEIDRVHTAFSRLQRYPIAIHVRRGDIIRNPVTMLGAWRGMYKPDEVVMGALQRIADSGRHAMIFCNDGEFVDRAARRFGDVLIKNENIQCDVETSILIDFMDIYKMSVCDHIIASGVSAFSAVGRNMGNSKIITFDEAMSAQDYDLACESARDRVFGDEQSFLCEGDRLQTINFLLENYLNKADAPKFHDVLTKAQAENLNISRYLASLVTHKNYSTVMGAGGEVARLI